MTPVFMLFPDEDPKQPLSKGDEVFAIIMAFLLFLSLIAAILVLCLT